MGKTKFTIIDYGIGNILSIKKAFEQNEVEINISDKKQVIEESSALILPGVGAFGSAISSIKKYELYETISKVIDKGTPVLGICLGMQLFMTKSEEFGLYDGFNFIDGSVKKIQLDLKHKKFKLPHIGWRKIFGKEQIKNNLSYLKDVLEKKYYFIHSFEAKPLDKNIIIARCKYYDTEINAIIQKENIVGCQFHPEKSGKNGLNFIKSFINFSKKN